MKTFEDRYQAWLAGRLSAEEAAAFERELPEVSAEQLAESERELAPLSRHLRGTPVPPLTGGDFFNYQLLEKLRQEEAARPAAPVKERRNSLFPWTFTNLAWSGVCAALAAVVVYQAWVHPKGEPLSAQAPAPVEQPLVSAAAPPRESNPGVQVASTTGQNPAPKNLRATDEPTAPKLSNGAVAAASTAGTRAAILTTFTTDPKVSAKPVQTDGDGVAIQLEGVEALPANFLLK